MGPVVTEVGSARQRELLGLGLDKRVAPFFRESEAHRRAVGCEGEIDDPAHPELDEPTHERLAGARKGDRQCANLVDRDHDVTARIRMVGRFLAERGA